MNEIWPKSKAIGLLRPRAPSKLGLSNLAASRDCRPPQLKRMSDPFGKVKGGRLTFKGGSLATVSKSIDKKKHKKKKSKNPRVDESEPSIPLDAEAVIQDADGDDESGKAGEEQVVYTIDAAKRMKYDQLFPVESKKFGYEPKSYPNSVEEALDDRVKKKADRYCK